MRLPTMALVILLALAFAVLMALGVWQLQRNEWKQDLVATSHERTDAAPVEVTDSAATTPAAVEYRRVAIEGEWLLDDVQFLANRARSSVRGEEILLPVRPPTGPVVLVNMGWIPDGVRDDLLRALRADAGSPIEGLGLDASTRRGTQIPSGSWSGLDVERMSAVLGYPVSPWFILAGEERTRDPLPNEPLPLQGWQRFENTTPHIEYALTWFGIAAALVAVAITRLVIVPRRERTQRTFDESRETGAP